MKAFRELKERYQQIVSTAYPVQIKKALLESVLGQLNQLSSIARQTPMELSINSCIKADKTQTNFTSLSHLSLTSCLLQQSKDMSDGCLPSNLQKEELQLKILEKQRVKCYLNEEIENLQDDYFQLQKILITKKEFNQELDNSIVKRSYEIGKKSCQKSAAVYEQDRKSLSSRIKSFFLS